MTSQHHAISNIDCCRANLTAWLDSKIDLNNDNSKDKVVNDHTNITNNVNYYSDEVICVK